MSIHLLRLDTMTFPTLMMTGTTPVSYKIIVTTALSEGVQMGTYPNIQACSSALPCRNNEGVGGLMNGLTIL